MPHRRIRIGCTFTYVAEIDTPVIFQVKPRAAADVAIDHERWASEPHMLIRGYEDLYGNPCIRAVLPAGRSTFGYEGVAVVPDAEEDADENAPESAASALPDDTLIYTLPSRYCLPDALGNEAWSRFGGLPPGYRRVQSICSYVNGHLDFQYGSSTAGSSAADVNTAGRGVCRDFTHLAISFCRALNIPARYVFGYLPDMDVPPDPAPMDFAAWMEVWLGDRWWTFDPRNNTRRKAALSSAGDETRPTWRWPRPSAARSLNLWWSRPRRCPGDSRRAAGTAIRRPGGAAVRPGKIPYTERTVAEPVSGDDGPGSRRTSPPRRGRPPGRPRWLSAGRRVT